MTRYLYPTIMSILLFLSVQGQDQKETSGYFNLVKAIVATEKTGNHLVYRLDTLKSTFIPSRSHVKDYFNRHIDFGFKHRRILIKLNFAEFQIDLLCRNDSVYLSYLTSTHYKGINYEKHEKGGVDQFLKMWNDLYGTSKTQQQLTREIALTKQYAFYCGFVDSKTREGKYIEKLVDDKNVTALVDMVKSFHCETQAYGITGLEMFAKKGYRMPGDVRKLIDRIKKRNAELVTCSGCIMGLVSKIYSKN